MSTVERQNLTLRMSNRRMARKTNAHSKKAINHLHAISIHYLHYNMCRVHSTLKTSPAMASGIADSLWSIKDMVKLMDEQRF